MLWLYTRIPECQVPSANTILPGSSFVELNQEHLATDHLGQGEDQKVLEVKDELAAGFKSGTSPGRDSNPFPVDLVKAVVQKEPDVLQVELGQQVLVKMSGFG